MAKGRKYLVVNNEAWQSFIEGATFHASLEDAQAAADKLATEAEESQPGVKQAFAVIEEAGILETEVQTKVKRNFATSRRIERKDKSAGATETNPSESGEQETEGSEASGSKRGRKRNK